MAGYHSVKDILTICSDEKLPIWKVIMEEDCVERQVVQSESFAGMRAMYTAMKQADKSYDSRRRSASGLAGGDGEKLHIYNMSDKKLCSDFTSLAMEKAVKMGESNACMRRIVAAPTAGSCGVIPAVFIAYEEIFNVPEDRIVEAMFITAGI